MSDLPIKPCLFNVLILQDEVKDTSEAGIFIGDVAREQRACESGTLVDVGPLAFYGISGCDPSKYGTNDPRFKMEPHQLAGFEIGDRVDFTRHGGESSAFTDNKRLIYVGDRSLSGRAKRVDE